MEYYVSLDVYKGLIHDDFGRPYTLNVLKALKKWAVEKQKYERAIVYRDAVKNYNK